MGPLRCNVLLEDFLASSMEELSVIHKASANAASVKTNNYNNELDNKTVEKFTIM